MVCMYCGGKTVVTNSRPQKRLRQTWRRRECTVCGAIFSTLEVADLASSLRVRSANGALQPFERDKLYVSIVAALGHRRDAVAASTAITATIIAKILKTAHEACVTQETIRGTTASTLEAFDTAGAVQYRAYHK